LGLGAAAAMLPPARQRLPPCRKYAALAVVAATIAAALFATSAVVAFVEARTFRGLGAPRRGASAALQPAGAGGRPSGWRRATSAQSAEAKEAGTEEDDGFSPQEAMELLEDMEKMDGSEAQDLATDDAIAEQIALEASSTDAEDFENDVRKQEAAELAAKLSRQVLSTGSVYDYRSLIQKYGGVNKIINAHKVVAEMGQYAALEQLTARLRELDRNIRGARKFYAEFKHASGSRLVLVGTDHLMRESADFARETVERERPECLVIERRLGDDSLQRLSIPEVPYMNLAMADAPGVFRQGDEEFDVSFNFQEDWAWLRGVPGWQDAGGPAALCLEFGMAFDEFARQRETGEAGGPRGGTLVFADTDVRQVMAGGDLGMVPSLDELAEGGVMALRDLSMATSMRAALRTHKSAVGVVGQSHMAGIIKLLQQDKSITMTNLGTTTGKADWLQDFDEDGLPWERELAGLSRLFFRLMETADSAPLGTFIAWDALKELQDYKEESAKRLASEGASAIPAAPRSSVLAKDFFARGLAASPKDEAELKSWLSGENLRQEAGDFPYENKRLRKKAPKVPVSGFAKKA